MRGLIRRTVVAAGAAALALGSAAVVSVATGATAQAASPCTTSGTTVTCTYTGAGTYSLPVPSGVTSLDVAAVGAAGGASADDGGDFSAGGAGASVEDAAVPVNAYQGQMLTVIVGGPGGAGMLDGSAGAGGAPGGGGDGGGGGDFPAGGGGGYSGLLDPSGTTALVIAAGGGGGAFDNPFPVAPGLFTGGAGDTGSGGGTGGGAASLVPNTGCPTSDSTAVACGGTGGTSTAGGEGGAGGAPGPMPGSGPGVMGGDGASLAGGPGGSSGSDAADNPGGGGGGGGGYYGGGGGGSGGFGAGGGGGSSFGVTGLTNEATAAAAASVTITYEAPLAVTTTSLPAATGGRSYTAALAATGGVTPYSWSVPPGTLPPGLSLSAAGVISGIPDVAGTYTFTVTVTDAESPAMNATKVLSITVSGPVINGLRPDHGPSSGGTLVKITGTGLSCPRHGGFSCRVSVSFGGHRAFVLFASPAAIWVIAPPGHGTVQVRVKVGGVSSQATAAGLFTYHRIRFPL